MRQEISYEYEERDPAKEEREREAYYETLKMMKAAEELFGKEVEEDGSDE